MGLGGRKIQPPRFWRSGSMGLVHRQHLFTPEDAREAMPLAGDSRRVLVADCRLNARDELRRTLDLDDRDRPDGALLLAAFERWGTDAVPRLHGEFSLALWDPAARRLLLARDHAGYRTLYFHRSERLVAFSTRQRALLMLPEVSRQLDDRALADFLILNHGPPTRTLYPSITRVPMAHIALIDAGGVHLAPHWTPPEPGSVRRRHDRDYEEEGRELLDRAVADVLRAQGPATLLLTGGLDSTAIAESGVRQLAPAPLLAVTRVPDGPTPSEQRGRYHDEAPRARALASRLPGLDWHRVGDDGGDWGEHDASRYFLESGAPSRAAQNIAWFYPVYRFMAARGSHVTIGGEQGNTYFSDSGLGFLPGMLTGLHWARLAAELIALARVERVPLWRVAAQNLVRPYAPLWLRPRRSRPTGTPWGRHAALNPGFASELDLERSLDMDRYRMRVGGGHRSVPALRNWIWQDEVARDLRGPFRALTGTDHRLPLADRRIVEFFGGLPAEQFLRNGVTRSIARRLLDARVPDETAHGLSRGVQNGDWFRILTAQRPAMLADLERMRGRPLARRVVDLDRLQSLLEHWPADIESAERRRTEYLQMLTRGMEMARFLAWHEGGN